MLALDPKNPQLAARLATAFRTWRTLEAGRRAKAQAALERIKAAPNLSRDLADIVERALAAPLRHRDTSSISTWRGARAAAYPSAAPITCG